MVGKDGVTERVSGGEVWLMDFRSVISGREDVTTVGYSLDGREGHMLRWLDASGAAVSVASGVCGWHEIHVGFMGACGFRVRLSNEPWFRWLESSVSWTRAVNEGEEAFLAVADLTDVDFELLALPDFERRYDQRDSQIAYLRLVSISAEEAARRGAALADRPTRTAGAVIDGHEVFGAHCPQTADEVRGLIAGFIDSDFKRLHFGCTVTSMRMCYLSRKAPWLGQGQPLDKLHSDGNRRCALAMSAGEQGGYDPLDVLIEFAGANHMELWPSYRIQQDYPFDYEGGFGYDFNSPFAETHQDWRFVDRHGEVCSHNFSHFHEGWEQYKLDLLAELAGKGPAGIHLNLMCEPSLFDFAPHAVVRFKQEYGVDPCATDEPPQEWFRFCCDHLTAFLRRLRTQTNAIAAELGRAIPIAVQVSADWRVRRVAAGTCAFSANLLQGFDIGRWAQEGLVDVIAPSFRRAHGPLFLDHIYEELGPWRDRIELAPSLGQHRAELLPRGYNWSTYFTDDGKGAKGLLPFGELDAWRVLRAANDVYQQGADSVDVWEMGHGPVRLARWNALKHIGEQALLEREFGTRVGPLMGRADNPRTFQLMQRIDHG